jgi:hypothetical protein
MYVCMYLVTCVEVHQQEYINIHTYTHANIHTYIHIHTYTYIHTYIHIYIQIYTYIHTSSDKSTRPTTGTYSVRSPLTTAFTHP